MISAADVITMRVPFPNVSSDLAVNSHMYICIKDGKDKEFIKCQTFKPMHNIKGRRPLKFIKESPDSKRNPFKNVTTIDCDKSFCVKDITVSRDLLTKIRKDVCSELFQWVLNEITHNEFEKENLDASLLLSINQKMRQGIPSPSN